MNDKAKTFTRVKFWLLDDTRVANYVNVKHSGKQVFCEYNGRFCKVIKIFQAISRIKSLFMNELIEHKRKKYSYYFE